MLHWKTNESKYFIQRKPLVMYHKPDEFYKSLRIPRALSISKHSLSNQPYNLMHLNFMKPSTFYKPNLSKIRNTAKQHFKNNANGNFEVVNTSHISLWNVY